MSDKVNFGAAERQEEPAGAGRRPGAEFGLGRIKRTSGQSSGIDSGAGVPGRQGTQQ